MLEKTEELEEDFESKLRNLQDKGEELLLQAQEVKKEAIEKVEEKKELLSKETLDKLDATLTKIEEVQQKGVELTQEVHHRYFKKGGKPLIS